VISGLRENEDREYRNDNVKSAFSRVISKLKNNKIEAPKKGLKQLRKTGSNFIADNEDFAEFYGMILDHTSVRNQHYLKSGRPHPKFDKAIVWLGEQFGFPTNRKH